MTTPLSFFPEKQDVNSVPIEIHNELIEQIDNLEDELKRCRQKVAHLIRENEELKAR